MNGFYRLFFGRKNERNGNFRKHFSIILKLLMAVTAGTSVLLTDAQLRNIAILEMVEWVHRSDTTIVSNIMDIPKFVFNPSRADASSSLKRSTRALLLCNIHESNIKVIIIDNKLLTLTWQFCCDSLLSLAVDTELEMLFISMGPILLLRCLIRFIRMT